MNDILAIPLIVTNEAKEILTFDAKTFSSALQFYLECTGE